MTESAGKPLVAPDCYPQKILQPLNSPVCSRAQEMGAAYWPVAYPHSDPDENARLAEEYMAGVVRRAHEAEVAAEEARIRAELVEKVRAAIFARVDVWTSADIDGIAEIAVQAFTDYYREEHHGRV